jgi:hypothetical protein
MLVLIIPVFLAAVILYFFDGIIFPIAALYYVAAIHSSPGLTLVCGVYLMLKLWTEWRALAA